MCICEYVIFSIDTCEKCFFRFEKGYKRFLFQVAPKHTALIYKPFLFWTFFLDIHKSCLKGDSL